MGQSTIDDVRIPQSVADFCTGHGISTDLQRAISLALDAFGPVRRLTVDLEVDYETGEPYVIVNVTRTLPVDEALDRRRDYTNRWIRSASPEARLHIRMLSDIS